MLELSFYWSLMVTQFSDNKRKDFWQMFLHHLITICLLGFSWTCNFTRLGVIVAVLHDAADPLMEVTIFALDATVGFGELTDAVN